MDFLLIYKNVRSGVDNLLLLKGFLDDDSAWLLDLAAIHRDSALQAIEAAENSNGLDSATHRRIAIGHMRDAFNAFVKYGDKFTPQTILAILGDAFLGIDGFYHANQELAWKGAVDIAVLIALQHKDLGESANEDAWADKAIKYFDKYVKAAKDRVDLLTRESVSYSGASRGDVDRETRQKKDLELAEEKELLLNILKDK